MTFGKKSLIMSNMRKILLQLLFCFIYLPVYSMTYSNGTDYLSGKWYLNNADTFFGGEMSISNCSDSVCRFNIQSWYDSHICDVDGELSIQNGFAEYKTTKYVYDNQTGAENYIPVGIVFNVLSQNKLNLRYINTDSDNAFCGMNATVEGVWIKQ